MRSRFRQNDEPVSIWPGFVDALSALLLVIIFTLLIFVVAQVYLGDLLIGKDKSIDLFRSKIASLTQKLDLLGVDHKKLATTLEKETAEKKQTQLKLSQVEAAHLEALDEGKKLKDRNLTADQEIALLNKQLADFNEQMNRLSKALEISNTEVQTHKIQLEKLKINEALLNKVEEMQRYRSQFFESLQKALGDRADMKIEGDRFVFQSEVLFDTASAELGELGKEKIDQLATTLKEVAEKLPQDINWVLRVDGHTDDRKVRDTSQFKSNWELSFGRAMAVVRQLMDKGIPANRLVATGFGEYYPIAKGTDAESLGKNRRIEIKLDQR